MRALHVVGALDPDSGGSTSAAFHTCGYLRQHGVDAVLAGSYASPDDTRYITETWPDLPVHGFGRRRPHHYWNSPGLRRWLKDVVADFDLVVAHGVFKVPFVDAASAARRHAVPYLVQPHGSLDPYDLQFHRLTKSLYGPLVVRRMLTGAGGVLVTSELERRRLVTYGAGPTIDVVPLPVAGPSSPPDGARFRKRFGIDETAHVVLFLSRLARKKGLERLFAAVSRLREQTPDAVLVVAGAADEAGYEDRLRQQAHALGAAEHVVWAGLLTGDAKWDAFAGSDVFALPSDNENFGIVVVEALLAERPVVISDEVYIAEELSAAGGALVCGRDVDSLVARLAQVLSDRRQAATMARAGRTVAERLFSPAAVTAETIAVYEATLQRGRLGSAPRRAG